MRLFATFSLSSVLLLLTACAPVYQTTYSYVGPKDQMGKMCAMQCQQSKTMCQQLCDSKTESCKANARQQAMFDYEQYKSQQTVQGKPIEKTLSDFNYGYRCDVSCTCAEDYNTCYTTCGGQVIPHTVCVAFCDKQK